MEFVPKDPNAAPNFRPTTKLRWNLGDPYNHQLEQRWVSDDCTLEEWRPIPEYSETLRLF